MTFCDKLRKACDDLWQGSFNHPFIRKIATEELCEEVVVTT